MRLSEALEGVALAAPLSADTEIAGVTCDSRRVGENFLFVAIPGGTFDGHRFLTEAKQKGATALLAQHGEGCILTDDTRLAYQQICANWFGHPERTMRFLGVTGTNGKTSSTQFVKSMLDSLGVTAGLLGTVCNQIGARTLPAAFTTPEPYQLFSILREMRDAGVETVVMEVSSQALDQHRTDSLPFAVAGFTNLTQDHLDYHGSMENYRAAKERLFRQSEKCVFNLDDETGRAFYKQYGGIGYSAETKADLFADGISIKADGVSYRLHCRGESADIHVPTPGLFTVHNTLCAAGILLSAGFRFDQIVTGLQALGRVPGRAEVVTHGLPYTVMLDYAHTPDALENILSTLRHCTDGRLVTLFGCGGDRDRTKRPKMGAAAAKGSDFLVVTSDNPRTEDPAAIIEEILPGVREYNTPYTVIENRREAIHWALENAKPGDLILLAGKGHEDYQILSTGKIPFDEKQIVKDWLAEHETKR